MPARSSPRNARVVLFPYAGEIVGGSVNSSFLLIRELLERGWPIVVGLHGDGPAADSARANGFPTTAMPPLSAVSEMARKDGFRLGNLSAAFACLRALKDTGAEIVHVNDKRMLRTWSLPALIGRRVLLNHWRSVYSRSASVNLGLKIAKRSLCVSRYSLETLPHWAQQRAEVVYNPFAAPSVEPGAGARIRAQAGIPAHAAVIGIFGTLIERKRPSLIFDLLDALPETADGRPVFGLVCGAWAEPRDKLFEAGLAAGRHAGRLVWPGHVSEPIAWMSACDAIVLPAVDEPLSRVGVEAQSLGLPPIVSSAGGLKEVVEHGVSGWVIAPDDRESWIAAVRTMLDDPTRRAGMAQASMAAAAELSITRHADRMEQVYASLLG